MSKIGWLSTDLQMLLQMKERGSENQGMHAIDLLSYMIGCPTLSYKLYFVCS